MTLKCRRKAIDLVDRTAEYEVDNQEQAAIQVIWSTTEVQEGLIHKLRLKLSLAHS